MKAYVNWLDEEIVNEEHYDKMVAEKTAELFDDDAVFEDFLAKEHSLVGIFDMDEDTKAEVRADFATWCDAQAVEELAQDWREYDL